MRNRKGYERIPVDENEIGEEADDKTKSPKKSLFDRVPHFLPEQFNRQIVRPIPWKSIAYATFLFIFGTALLLCGCLIHTGHVDHQVPT